MHYEHPAADLASLSNRATSVRWRIVALLMAASFLCLFNRLSMTVAGAERLIDGGVLSEDRMGMVYSSYLLVYTLCMLPGGWLIDRYGTRISFGAMGIGAGICVMLTGVVGLLGAPALLFFVSLLVIRGLTGLLSVPMFPGAARTVAAWVPPANRSLANGLVTAAALLGAAGTFYIFGALMERYDWTGAFLVSGVVTLVFAGVWIIYARSDPAEHPGVNLAELRLIHPDIAPNRSPGSSSLDSDAPISNWASAKSLLLNPNLMLLTVSYALAGYFQSVFFFWIQYYFKDVLGLGVDLSRRYATFVNLAMAVGMFTGGWVADALSRRIGSRRGRASVAISGLLAGAAFLYLGLGASDQNWIVAWFSLSMGAVGMAEGPFWVTATDLGGRRGGASAAIFNTGGNLGSMIAPFATPIISGYFGWRAALLVASLVCVAAATLWLFIQPGPREHDAASKIGVSR